MGFKFIIYCFLIVILSSLVSAQDLDSYEHTVDLQETNSLHEVEVRATVKNFDLVLPTGIKDLVTSKECELEEEEDYLILRCSFDKLGGILKISFVTTDPILRTEDKIVYKSEFIPVNPVKKFSYSLKLPLGFVIPEKSEFYITPKPTDIRSDGRRVVLLWERQNVKSIFELSVMMEPVASYSRGDLWLVVLSLVVLGVIVGIYYLRKPKENIKYTALIENEKSVVDVLKKNKNVLWQKQIQIKTGFSKVKLSRILQSLEKREVIKKEPFGNTNKIHLISKK